MLLQNDTFVSQYPLRFSGGAAVTNGAGSSSLISFLNPGKSTINRFCGQGGIDQHNGWAVGYRGTSALIQPLVSGGLGATITGGETVLSSILGTHPLTCMLTGTGSVISSQVMGLGVISAMLTGQDTVTSNAKGLGILGAFLQGAENFSFLGTLGVGLQALLSGGEIFQSTGALGKAIETQMTGSSTIQSTGALGKAIQAALVGNGDITQALLDDGIVIPMEIAAFLIGLSVLGGQLGRPQDISAFLYGTSALPGVPFPGMRTSWIRGH